MTARGIAHMQVRLLERYSEQVCPEKAAEYQACYTASLARGDTVLDNCSKQVSAELRREAHRCAPCRRCL